MRRSGDREHVPLPPFVFLAGVLLGLGLDYLIPLRVIPEVVQLPGGIIGIGGGILLALLSAATLWRASTSPLHERPTTAIVARGAFAWSRNPIYVAFVILCAGLALYFDRIWIVAGCIPAVLVIHFVVIAREEEFLEAKFGQDYLDYKAKVRRWI